MSQASEPTVNPTFAGNGNPDLGYNPFGARNTDSAVPLHPKEPVTHDYRSDGPAAGRLGFRWTYGSKVAAKNRDPRVQVVQYNEDTFVLRQNVCVHWEAPFTYLLFGNKGALLIDSGATSNGKYFPLRETVDKIITRWGQARARSNIPLTVALTSGEDIAQNSRVGPVCRAVRYKHSPDRSCCNAAALWVSENWPSGTGAIDLGDRVIDVVPTPGTHKDGITFYDPYCRILFTGDLLFPGRSTSATTGTILPLSKRLKAFAAGRSPKWILGGHVEMMFVPGKFYPRFANHKPYERVLQMEPALIDEALQYARGVQGKDMMLIRPDFALFNGVSPDQRTQVWPEGVPNISPPSPY